LFFYFFTTLIVIYFELLNRIHLHLLICLINILLFEISVLWPSHLNQYNKCIPHDRIWCEILPQHTQRRAIVSLHCYSYKQLKVKTNRTFLFNKRRTVKKKLSPLYIGTLVSQISFTFADFYITFEFYQWYWYFWRTNQRDYLRHISKSRIDIPNNSNKTYTKQINYDIINFI